MSPLRLLPAVLVACATPAVSTPPAASVDTPPLSAPACVPDDGPEVADGHDHDCDGIAHCPVDADGDGVGGAAERAVPPGTVCGVAPGTAHGAGDCDDTDAAVGSAPTWWADADRDGHGDPRTAWASCDPGPGWVGRAGDCDDDDDTTHPGAIEWPGDGRDNDCDGVDRCHVDADGDGAGGADVVDVPPGGCPTGTAPTADDCDDDDPTLQGRRWFTDADADGRGDPSTAIVACEAPPGTVADASDCDDTDPRLPSPWHADADADGHGVPTDAVWACARPAGHVDAGDDCDDTDAGVHPDAVEVCDGRDDDCDGRVDTDDDDLVGGTLRWRDDDADGWGVGVAQRACTIPVGTATRAGDCDDDDATRWPGAAEIPWDGVDQDCDGLDLVDVDGDGWEGGPGGDDCDDADADVHPGAVEVCGNGVDDDCDPTPRRCGLGGRLAWGDAPGRIVGVAPGAWIGAALAGGVDLSDDGWPDLLVGAPGLDADPGAGHGGAVLIADAADLGGGATPSDATWARLVGHAHDGLGWSVGATSDAALGPMAWLGAPTARDGGVAVGAVRRSAGPFPAGDHDVGAVDGLWGITAGGRVGARFGVAAPQPSAPPTLATLERDLDGTPGAAFRVGAAAWSGGSWWLDTARRGGVGVVTTITGPDAVFEDVAAGPSPTFGEGAHAIAYTAGDAGGVIVVDAAGGPDAWSTDAVPEALAPAAWTLPTMAGGRTVRVALVPDVTGDGVPDLVVGDACRHGCLDGGSVTIVSGIDPEGALDRVGLDLPGTRIVHPTAGAAFGGAVAAAGDVDGNGVDDLIVGAPADGGGTAWILLGPLPAGTYATTDVGGPLPGAVIDDAPAGALAGFAVAGLGDVDGDGVDDVAVGAPGAPTADGRPDGGQVVVWFGGRE